MTAAVTARWEGFLSQLRERFIQILGEAQEGCPQLLAESDHDPIPMGNAWGAIEMRAKQLETKVEETWNGQVDGAFEQAGAPAALIAHERAKGQALRDWFEVERERVRIAIYANAGRAIFARGQEETGRTFPCVRCGSPLEVPFTFRAVNFPCRHCNTVNGFEPGMRIRMAEVCIHPLCEEAAWGEWLRMHEAGLRRRRSRDTTLELIKNDERAQIAYWRAYFTARTRYMPDAASAYEADVRGRMAHFYDAAEREAAWTMAGRPRDSS